MGKKEKRFLGLTESAGCTRTKPQSRRENGYRGLGVRTVRAPLPGKYEASPPRWAAVSPAAPAGWGGEGMARVGRAERCVVGGG